MTTKLSKKAIIKAIFETLRAFNPKPATELKYSTPYELLVAVVLSAQATDVSVNKVTLNLFKVANTPAKMVKLGIVQLETYIKSIGLYKIKAKNVITLSQELLVYHNGSVPEEFDELIKLPGVGRKTANVILNTLFNRPVIAVDTHIFRVANRLGIAKGNTPLIVEKKLAEVVPDEFKKDAHHWLILHGRYVCKARKPDCENCIINKYCEYYKIQQANLAQSVVNMK